MSGRKFDRILVAIADPAAGLNKAVRRARALAHATGASIELFHAIPQVMSLGPAHASGEQFTRYEAEQTGGWLERTANRLRREEIIVTTSVQTGYPIHEAILRQVRRTKPDLLIIEARKHSFFARLLLSQTDFELIRHCPIPLLIVKGLAAWRSPRILAALDPFHAHDKPSVLDGEIIDAAQAIASVVHGSVHAAHVYRPFASYFAAVPMSEAAAAAIPAQEKSYTAAIRRGFHDAATRHGIGRKKAHLVCGDPATALPGLARSMRAGLVVMGAMSRSGLKRIFIGNTAERVLDTLQCDVLVVRPRN
ncbi:MAG TPA: universal stress protein [Steroidobacteraceae bacterium]|nr:universal stress protein [Steroidobacteraceae bacterium]